MLSNYETVLVAFVIVCVVLGIVYGTKRDAGPPPSPPQPLEFLYQVHFEQNSNDACNPQGEGQIVYSNSPFIDEGVLLYTDDTGSQQIANTTWLQWYGWENLGMRRFQYQNGVTTIPVGCTQIVL